MDEKLQNADCTEKNTVAESKTTEVIEIDELFDNIKGKKQDLRDNVCNKKSAINRRL